MLDLNSKYILRFLEMLALVRESFRRAHLELDASSFIKKVDTTVTPFRSRADRLEDRVTFSYFLDGELMRPLDADRQSIGASLLLRFFEDRWVAEGEIGWTGFSVGWDSFTERICEADNAEDFLQKVPIFAEELLADYIVETKTVETGQETETGQPEN